MTRSSEPTADSDRPSPNDLQVTHKSLDEVLADVAAMIAFGLPADREAAVVVRDRRGARRWGRSPRPPATAGSLGAEPRSMELREVAVAEALDDGRTWHNADVLTVAFIVDERVIGALMITASATRDLDAADLDHARDVVIEWAPSIADAVALAEAPPTIVAPRTEQ